MSEIYTASLLAAVSAPFLAMEKALSIGGLILIEQPI